METLSSSRIYQKVPLSGIFIWLKIPGTKAGGNWENKLNQLPVKPDGYYKEYDVNPKIQGESRDKERFVVGNGGEIYYTNNHYGQYDNGEPDFYLITK